MSTGDMDSNEHMKSVEDEVSEGRCFYGKHFFWTHNRFNYKHTHRTCVNEIGVKVLEESMSHDHDATLECSKAGLMDHVKERVREMEINKSISLKPSCAKSQVKEMNSSAIAKKLVKICLINLRKNRNKNTKLFKNFVSGINKWAVRHCNHYDVQYSDHENKLITRKIITSPTSVMILIIAKSMLKLMQNDDLQLRHNTWNVYLLLHAL